MLMEDRPDGAPTLAPGGRADMISSTVTAGLDQDAADLADDARRLLVELDREVPGVSALTAECRPPLSARRRWRPSMPR